MTASVAHLGGRAGSAPATERYTIDALARVVGMSPRNIRAHQARGLLAPPTRHGRTAYYAPGHVRRLESIKALQRQGFNLVAIEAILGVRRAVPAEPLTAALSRLAAEHPALAHTLARHGVLAQGEDGTVSVARGRTVRPALDLQHAGVPPLAALTLLGEVLDQLRPVAEDLVRVTGTRVLALRRSNSAVAAPGQLDDPETTALTRSLIGLLSEAFRVVAENSGESAVPTVVAGPAPRDPGR